MGENKITILTKLKKPIFKGINLFEIILFSLFSTIGVIIFILSIVNNSEISLSVKMSYIFTLIDIPLGIIAATSLSKRSKYAPLLLVIDALLYGTSNFLVGNISLGFVNAIITPILWIIAFFYFWKGNMKEEGREVETRKLNLKTGFVVVISVVLVATLLAIALHWNSFKTNNLINSINVWFDSFAAALMLAAVVMGMLRFREVWYLYLLANILKITLFIVNLSVGNNSDVMLLIMSSAYLTNSIFGLFIWYDSTHYN